VELLSSSSLFESTFLQDRMRVATSRRKFFSKSAREMVSEAFVWIVYEKSIVSSMAPPCPFSKPGQLIGLMPDNSVAFKLGATVSD
jgi:hypothetical protein